MNICPDKLLLQGFDICDSGVPQAKQMRRTKVTLLDEESPLLQLIQGIFGYSVAILLNFSNAPSIDLLNGFQRHWHEHKVALLSDIVALRSRHVFRLVTDQC